MCQTLLSLMFPNSQSPQLPDSCDHLEKLLHHPSASHPSVFWPLPMDPWMLWIDSFLGLIQCLMLAREVTGGGWGGDKNSPGNWILILEDGVGKNMGEWNQSGEERLRRERVACILKNKAAEGPFYPLELTKDFVLQMSTILEDLCSF